MYQVLPLLGRLFREGERCRRVEVHDLFRGRLDPCKLGSYGVRDVRAGGMAR